MASKMLNSLKGVARDIEITDDDGVRVNWKNASLALEWNMKAHMAAVEHLGGREVKVELKPTGAKGSNLKIKLGNSNMQLLEGELRMTFHLTVDGDLSSILG